MRDAIVEPISEFSTLAAALLSIAVASHALTAWAAEIELHVNKNGSYTLDHRLVSREQLRAALSRLTAKNGVEVLITGERGITFPQVDYAVETAKGVGAKFRLSDKPVK
jgi:biopolymer transport protein ExbD